MARLLYVLSHSTDDPRRAATGLAAAAAAADAHEVGVWLTDEGVRLAVQGVADALLEEGPRLASDSLAALQAQGARLHVSRPCFVARGFETDQLVDGAEPAEPIALATLVAEGWVPIPAS
jgi:predicted peroxiredoxin